MLLHNVWIYLLFTFIFSSIYAYLYTRSIRNDSVDPALYMDTDLTPSQKLKVQIHASHHTNSEVKNMVDKLQNGSSWHDVHSTLKPMGMFHHIEHIDTEIIQLLSSSLSISVGLLFAFTIQTITDIFAPTNNKIMAAWYYINTFLITLLFFSVLIMISKHYLSFRTWKIMEY